MKTILLVPFAFTILASRVLGGSFTLHETRIAVPALATGTDTGDTMPASSGQIHLDATVYLPEGVSAPAPVVVVLHGFAGSKDDSKNVELAQDFAAAGYVVLTPTLRGFGNSEGEVTLAGPSEINDLKTIILAMQTGSIGDAPAVSIPVTSASKFGVLGTSYGGGQTFELARTHVAGLSAIFP